MLNDFELLGEGKDSSEGFHGEDSYSDDMVNMRKNISKNPLERMGSKSFGRYVEKQNLNTNGGEDNSQNDNLSFNEIATSFENFLLEEHELSRDVYTKEMVAKIKKAAELNFDFNKPLPCGEYMIHIIATQGNIQILQAMLDAGADFSIRNTGKNIKYKGNALYYTALGGHLESFIWLQEKGATLTSQDAVLLLKYFDFVKNISNKSISELNRKIELIDRICEFKPNPAIMGSLFENLLRHEKDVSQEFYSEGMSQLLDIAVKHEFKPNEWLFLGGSRSEMRLLHSLAKHDSSKYHFCKRLINAGLDSGLDDEEKSFSSENALYYMMMNKDFDHLDALIDAGAKLTPADASDVIENLLRLMEISNGSIHDASKSNKLIKWFDKLCEYNPSRQSVGILFSKILKKRKSSELLDTMSELIDIAIKYDVHPKEWRMDKPEIVFLVDLAKVDSYKYNFCKKLIETGARLDKGYANFVDEGLLPIEKHIVLPIDEANSFATHVIKQYDKEQERDPDRRDLMCNALNNLSYGIATVVCGCAVCSASVGLLYLSGLVGMAVIGDIVQKINPKEVPVEKNESKQFNEFKKQVRNIETRLLPVSEKKAERPSSQTKNSEASFHITLSGANQPQKIAVWQGRRLNSSQNEHMR